MSAEITSFNKSVSYIKHFDSGRDVQGASNPPELKKSHESYTGSIPFFRFPPEPNGFLHIGHAKSMRLNFGEALLHQGKCYLRYDDTNPETEEQIYIDAILEMVKWMGWSPDFITYSSDYFDKLYEFALVLIKKGYAYVDHSTASEIKRQREERIPSPWRDRSVEENLRYFDAMKRALFAEGEATLRLKMDMKHDNPNMRDLIAYRIKYSPHPRTGSTWCIYPSYDYTHCIVDSLEHIDYSLCTLEFEIRRESYFWLLEKLDLYRPYVWEFSRLNVTGSLLSKRKINLLVHKKIVRGFDDPRLLTLAGLRRRGYQPKSINDFCDLVGVTRSQNVIDIKMLEHTLRTQLDATSERRFGVLEPLKLVIENYDGKSRVLSAPNHPKVPELGNRDLSLGRVLYIEQSDFREVDDKKYFGLCPDPMKAVGLKYGPNIHYLRHEKDSSTNKVTCVYVTIDDEKKVKPKTHIHWLNASEAKPTEFRLYDPLLTDDRAATETDFLKYVNPNSETIVRGFVEPAVSGAIRTTFQFERVGYFTIDDDTEKQEHLVMNRVISLKESKE